MEVKISSTSGTHKKYQGSGHVRNQLEIVLIYLRFLPVTAVYQKKSSVLYHNHM